MGVYRVELAPSARAICRNTECKKNQVKIPKGDLRFCTQTDMGGNISWAYKHWGCTTPQQIKNLKDSIEDNIDYLDGLDELPSELRPKVLKALEEGHVADSDWRGDLSQNRPGSTSFRSPASKKSKKKLKSGDNEDEHNDASPIPAPKKRGRSTKAEDVDDVNEPPTKKMKAVSKKGNSNQNENVIAEDETRARHSKQGRGKTKRVNAAQNHEKTATRFENGKYETTSKSPQRKGQAEADVIASTIVDSEEKIDYIEDGTFEEPKAKKGRKKAAKKAANGSEEISKKIQENRQTVPQSAEKNIENEKPKKARGRLRASVI